MRQPSIFIRSLVIIVGILFVLVFSLMKEPIPAIVAFLFFFFLWSALESVVRDPTLETSKARQYFRVNILFGALTMIAAVFFFFSGLAEGRFESRSLVIFAFMAGIAWRFKGEWKGWLRK